MTANGAQPSGAAVPGGRTLAECQIAAFATLAEQCARPPRFGGPVEAIGQLSCAFFLISSASVAWVEAAAADPRIRLVDVSIEAMGTFAAIEASIATGAPQLVICGAGPGTLGHLWAVPAARAQGASVLLLIPRTSPHLAGTVDVQESSTYDPLHAAGATLFDAAISMEDVCQLPGVVRRLRGLFARPQGAIVALDVPVQLLGQRCAAAPGMTAVDIEQPAPSAAVAARVRALLRSRGGPPAFLLGSGAVPYPAQVAAVVEHYGAVHFSTPAATGLLPNSLGSIGNAAGGEVGKQLVELGVQCVVVLGSRLGTASGGSDRDLLPANCHVIHVDIDPDLAPANAAALREHRVTVVRSDIGAFLDAIAPHNAKETS